MHERERVMVVREEIFRQLEARNTLGKGSDHNIIFIHDNVAQLRKNYPDKTIG
jgi:hypothetical protein